jgi:hypothetical protein
MTYTDIELLAYQRLAETGLSAAELLKLDADEYARVTSRPTPTQAAIAALDAQHASRTPEPVTPGEAAGNQAVTPSDLATLSSSAPGIDFSQISMQEYAALRGQLGMGQAHEYGRGILDGDSTDAWIAAAQRKAGRSAMHGRNVTESPQVERRYVNQDALRDTRTAAQRFTTPGNAFS